MDVRCATCGEPWDVDHLRHDAIFDIGLSSEEAEAWKAQPPTLKLSPRYRERFRAAGWEFGASIITVLRCPCCPKDAVPDPERVQPKSALERLMGEDEDGLAAAFEDFGL